jgi:predicted 3-demethylubiquinone-9 3-methyltransferase (glyoxalase superfamily)
LFDHEAEEAATFYVSVFKNAKIAAITRYTKAGFEIIIGQPAR